MEKPFEVAFPNGAKARAVRVRRSEELPAALLELGLGGPRPVLVLVGGAGGLNDADEDRLRPLFTGTLAPLAEASGASVVDGGTDAGVMRLMGRARAGLEAAFPLIGVAADGTVSLPGGPPPRPDAAPLEPHHTHFVLVPGSEWGDEARWLVRVASALAGGAPSVTVLVNGGDVAWEDVSRSVEAGRPVIAVSGSGRAADALAGALRGEANDGRARELAMSGLLRAVDLSADPPALAETIEEALSAR
jgi:SLOG in TRPM, prokaryote